MVLTAEEHPTPLFQPDCWACSTMTVKFRFMGVTYLGLSSSSLFKLKTSLSLAGLNSSALGVISWLNGEMLVSKECDWSEVVFLAVEWSASSWEKVLMGGEEALTLLDGMASGKSMASSGREVTSSICGRFPWVRGVLILINVL